MCATYVGMPMILWINKLHGHFIGFWVIFNVVADPS